MTDVAGEQPTVSIVIPTYCEADSIDACLAAVAAQTYPSIIEVLVVDGRSGDDTRERARAHPQVTVLDNPDRVQSAALNIGLAAARGEVVVRVDGHSLIEADYVQRCVEALERTGAAVVGGAMSPRAAGTVPTGIAAAMRSRFGAGPARFHTGGAAGWVDTVYLGAYRRATALVVGGYDASMAINEDAEFAYRMGHQGGIWFDPGIRSTYTPRSSLADLGRQFYRYGRGRAVTVRRHPDSVQARQLAAPILVLALLSPLRRTAVAGYAAVLGIAAVVDGTEAGDGLPVFLAALPVMHLAWGAGFLLGLVAPTPGPVAGESARPLQP